MDKLIIAMIFFITTPFLVKAIEYCEDNEQAPIVAPQKAEIKVGDFQVINECQTTPEFWELKPPPDIVYSNNLRRLTSSLEFAKGDFIIIEGKVVDSQCVPISDAIVEIWQANSLGGLDYYDNSEDNPALKDVNFAGSGSTITDNMGYYSFITVFPGSVASQAPHVNFRVRHKDFLPIETIMYFENNPMNNRETLLNQQINQERQKLLVAKAIKSIINNSKDNIKYQFDITLEGNNKYKKY